MSRISYGADEPPASCKGNCRVRSGEWVRYASGVPLYDKFGELIPTPPPTPFTRRSCETCGRSWMLDADDTPALSDQLISPSVAHG